MSQTDRDKNEFTQLLPRDQYNRALESNVRPPSWKNPAASGRYNLVVIGAGTAGLVAAAGAAGLGARVALIERNLMGGDCLNVGCVPSKGLISAARVASTVRNAGNFGIEVSGDINADFAAAMQRMRRARARISPHDSARRFRDLGVDVYFGQARFVDSKTVDVDGTRLRFKRAVIATGARAAAPPIPGLDGVEYLTNETLFSLTELPRRFGIVGAGPIGTEMAQAFAQLGSQVYLVEATHGILPREDRDAAQIVQDSICREGVTLLCCGRDLEIKKDDGIRLTVDSHDVSYSQQIDKLLLAAGRTPNIEGLGLDAVDVEYDSKGIHVNDRLQTANPRIFAAGDICSRFQFTHAADFMARIVIQNALFRGRKKFSTLTIPWCTYTSPEIAHVGLHEKEAADRGIPVDTYTQHLGDVDRAILEGDDEGMVRVHVKRGTDEILGATVVARNAGDLVCEITLAMTHRMGLAKIGSAIHPYPTQAEAIRKLGDQYNRTRLTPLARSLLGKWLAWTR